MRIKSLVRISEVEEIWRKIGSRDGFLSLPIPHPLSFQLGRSHHGKRCFAVVGFRQRVKVESSRAISVRCDHEGQEKWVVTFSLEDDSLSEVFVKFCWDLIECSRESNNPEAELLFQYKKWRRMFASLVGEGMSDQVQKGLLGELLYLRELIERIGQQRAVAAWQGPDGCDQDFVFETGWSEIKTVKTSATDVSISSLQQLERQDIGWLIVYFADKDNSDAVTSVSVKDVAMKIADLISDDMVHDLFECKLARAGYVGGDISYNKYHVEKRKVFGVNGRFPRICPENVPAAVSMAQYALSLPAIQQFEVED